jgi:dTDP-4-amino-4,6-dideoxygalactose transaminase
MSAGAGPQDGAAESSGGTEAAAACPNARSLTLRCLLFPLYPTLGKRDVEAVCRVLSTMP